MCTGVGNCAGLSLPVVGASAGKRGEVGREAGRVSSGALLGDPREEEPHVGDARHELQLLEVVEATMSDTTMAMRRSETNETVSGINSE